MAWRADDVHLLGQRQPDERARPCGVDVELDARDETRNVDAAELEAAFVAGALEDDQQHAGEITAARAAMQWPN